MRMRYTRNLTCTNRRVNSIYTEGINIKSHVEFNFGVNFAFWGLFYKIDTLSRVTLYSVLRANHVEAFGRPP